MSTTFAPAQLPIAPRPVSSELFSSWMLRVASGNCISLWELFEAVGSKYSEAFALNHSIFPFLPCSFAPSLASAECLFGHSGT